MNNYLFSFKEHDNFCLIRQEDSDAFLKYIDFESQCIDKHFLGLDYDYRGKSFQANYYIGLDWIDEGKTAIMVEPKIKGLDYLSMFMKCFDCDNIEAKEKLKNIYHIDFNRESINIESNTFELTPLLVVHFLKLMQSLVKRNLKRDYIQREENLNSKIKGKILFSKNVKYNIFKGRNDRFYCRYQDYSDDCIENRILKKTLMFVSKYLSNKIDISCKAIDLNNICNSCLAVFELVSDDLSIQQIKQFKINPLFKEYAESLKVAKLILRRFSYSIDNATSEIDRNLPPFWINMPLLFEVYVLTLLQKEYGKDNIGYQVNGKYGTVDYLRYKEPLIIDAKYKPIYSDRIIEKEDEKEIKFEETVKGRFKIEDIRQLSGYARDKEILYKLGIEKEKYERTVIPCLIIYPLDETQKENKDDILSQKEQIESFTEFYKIGIKLPKQL